MIDSAEVVKALPEKVSTMVDTERQVGELAKIPAEDRAGVVQGIVQAGKPVTAAEIKRHLPPPPMQRSAPPTQVLDGTGLPSHPVILGPSVPASLFPFALCPTRSALRASLLRRPASRHQLSANDHQLLPSLPPWHTPVTK